eukprot:gene8926-9103_t
MATDETVNPHGKVDSANEENDQREPLLAFEEPGVIMQQSDHQQQDQLQLQRQSQSPHSAVNGVQPVIGSGAIHQLHIEAAVTAIPIVTGHPIGFAEGVSSGLAFLPDLPDVAQLWNAQHILMILWLLSSLVSLLLLARSVPADPIFFGAEVAAVMGIMASSMHLCSRRAAGENTPGFGAITKSLLVNFDAQHPVSKLLPFFYSGDWC